MNTTTWKNRALSVMLTVIMVFSMLPLSAFAASGAVAEVDGTAYTNLIEAFDAAQGKESATVKLLADVSASGNDGSSSYCDSYGGYNFKSGKVTLELNGQTLTWTAGSGRAPCVYGATLTVQDSQGGGKLYSENGEALQITSGTLNIQSGTIESDGGNALQITGGTVHITGGTIHSNGYYGEGVYISPDTVNNRTATLTISGDAELIGGTNGSGLRVRCKSDENPTVRLSGGTYTGKSGIQCNNTTVGTLLDENCRYMLGGSEVTDTGVSTLGSGVTVEADPNAPVQYVDANGVIAQANCTDITTATGDFKDGWYVVKGNASGYTAFVSGTVNLILCDGAEWSMRDGGLYMGKDAVLNIYAQSAGTGKLTATGVGTKPAIGMDTGKSGGTLNIYGGVITATSYIPSPSASGEAGVSENRGAAIGTCGGSLSSMAVNIYGGTVTAKATYGAAAIGKGQAATGTVTVTIADGMKCVKTDDLTAKAAYNNTEGDSVTITKCDDHRWTYTKTDDTHTAKCTLCGKDSGAVNHSYTGWTDNGNGTHTGTCVCEAESTEDHALTFTPNTDGLTHSTKCSGCGYEVGTEDHDFNQTDEYGKKCACGAYLAASYNGQNYTSLTDAVEAAKDGGTVKLEKGVGENITIAEDMTVTIDLNNKIWTTDGAYAHPTLTVTGGSVTVQNGNLTSGASSNAATTVVVEGGKLTVGDSMTIEGGSMAADIQFPAIGVKGGELTLSVGTKLGFGMKVSVEGKQLKDYLPAGTAFHQVLRDNTESVANGYVQEYVGKFTLNVVAHPAHDYTDGKCACGFVCDHTGGNSREAGYFRKAVCATCKCEYGEVTTDTTAPTGRITVTERNWFETFLNTISFNLFFKEEVKATVTAEDDSREQTGYDESKHAVKIEYLVSNKALTEADLANETLVAYDKDKGIDLTGEQKYVVYARLTDHAGNVTYLSTDGFVIDKTAPSIGDFDDGQEVHICNSTYTVSVQDNYLKEVTVDGKKQTGDSIGDSITFYVAESGNTHTVVAEDWAGNTSTVKFTLHGGHNYNIETGVCENNCGAAAEVRVTDDTGTHVWEQFGEALRILYKSTTPVTVTLLRDCRYADYTQIIKNELTVDLNGHNFGNASDRFCVAQQDAENKCKLTITGEGRFEPSILLASGSTLTVDENVTYVGGIKSYFHTHFGDKVTDLSVTLKGGKYGVIDLTYEDGDGNTQTAGTLCDLLAPGYVFTDSTTADSSSAANVEVVPCTNHEWNDGVCTHCKLECTHNWNGSKCTVCGYVCSHSSVEERGDDTYCTTCEQQLVVKVEKDDSTTYYAKHFEDNEYHAENTLKGVFNETPNASTVTLLANDLLASGWITGKNITLDMNGKNIIENNGIVVDIDSDTKTGGRLFVCGEGSSTVPEESMYTCTFRVLSDSELVLNENFSGNYGTIYLENGVLTSDSTNMKIGALVIQDSNAKITLKGGKFGTIITQGNITKTAGSLLERYYAFQKADGSYVAYDTEISEVKALENVTVVKCDHRMAQMPTGNQYNRLHCPNCDEALGAVLTTADGKINGYKDLTDGFGRTGALSVAETTPGCTVTMYYDAEWLSIRSTAEGFTLDANDCEIAQLELHEGALTVKNATITGSTHNSGVTVVTYSDFFDTFRTTLTLENCEVQKLEGADPTTLRANGPVTLKNTVVYGKTSVLSDTEEGLTVDGSDLTGDVTVRGNLTFKSGYAGKITVYGAAEISGGAINELDATDAGSLTVSGGMFGKITAPGEKKLIDCLKDGYAFYNNHNSALADGRAGTLVGVYVAEHTHGEYQWDTATNELVCACGDVKETDTTVPTFGGIVTGETYYQNTRTFTAEDTVSGIKEVKDGDTPLTADENGNYTVTADNKVHTITATDNAGNTATVTVTVYKVYKVTLPSGTGYSVEGNTTIGYGQKYTFTVTIAEGYSRVNGSYKVLMNDTEVNAGSGDETHDRFAVTALGNLTITVEGVADITAPEAEMTIGESKFKSFLNTITFGLFFKKTQTVTVTADDAGSGVAKAEYLLSETAFATGKDVTGDWKSFDMKNGKGSFSIAPNAKGSVYVRVTDNAGNYTVINSDGMVVYTDSEAVTESITFTRLSKTDVTVTVDFRGNTVKSVFCDGNELNGTSYKVLYPSADSGSTLGTVELKNMFLSNLAAGEYTITVEYNPMGETYVEAAENDAPDFTEVNLTVVKAERTLTFDAPNAIYDGEAYDDLRITDKPGRTTVHYKEQDADDSTYGTAAPKNAGSYTVKITVDADEDYNAKTFTKDFTISPKEVTIKDVVVKAVKEYDGSAAAEDMKIAAAYIDGKCAGDELTIDITDAEANFSDKNVGVGKTVTFSGFKLGGSAKDNYKLTAQPASVKADIIARELTVKGLKIKNKQYDGTNAAEMDGTPTLNGVVDGDTLTLVNGTPVFDSTAVGEDIAIIFTAPFTLAGDEVTVKNYTLTQPTGITGNIVAWIADGSEYSVNSNNWINTDFTVTAKTGYQLSLIDAANGTWTDTLTASKETADGKLTFYVRNTATGVISSAVTENYRIDKTAPTGTITLNERTPFQKFLNTITFNLFFKDDVTVKLGADDEASGVKSVEYYKSDEALTLEEVKAVTDWTEGNSFGITAEDMAQFVIYARITDNAGNITYLSSDGAEFDTTAPEIVGVKNGKTYYVTRRVAADDANLKSVTVNGDPVDMDVPFELVGDKNAVYTVVATDKAGNVTEYTVTMKPISDITDAIKDITAENVKSSDADAVDAVTQQILDIAAESDEEVIGEEQWNKLTAAAANCKKLQTHIAAVATELDRLTVTVGDFGAEKVTSTDKTDLEQLITDIDALLVTDNLTDAERAALEAQKETAQALLDRIADAKGAAESDEITAVKDITKDNVALGDKDALEKAEKALEKALDDFDGNYTDDERKALNDKLDTVKAALDAIENAEKAVEEIEKLPSADDVKLSDKDEIERISKIIDDLTENEKAMLGEKAIGKLKTLSEKLTEPAADKPTSPGTGDTSNLALWIALLFVSGGVITGVSVAGKKKKQQDR